MMLRLSSKSSPGWLSMSSSMWRDLSEKRDANCCRVEMPISFSWTWASSLAMMHQNALRAGGSSEMNGRMSSRPCRNEKSGKIDCVLHQLFPERGVTAFYYVPCENSNKRRVSSAKRFASMMTAETQEFATCCREGLLRIIWHRMFEEK